MSAESIQIVKDFEQEQPKDFEIPSPETPATPLPLSIMDRFQRKLGPLEKRVESVDMLLQRALTIQEPAERLRALNKLMNEKNIDRTDYIVTDINNNIRKKDNEGKKTDFELRIARATLAEFGLSDEAMAKIEHSFTLNEYSILRNIRKMLRLETKEPGIVKYLLEENGLTNFTRDCDELLLRQYKERNLVGEPYVLVTRALDDHNGAFDPEEHTKDLLKQCKKYGIPLRIIEARDKEELQQLLDSLVERYGEHQAGLWILAAHGVPDRAYLSGNNTISTYDLEGELGNSLGKACTHGASAVMWSCSTGRELARTVSMVISGNAVGPNIPAPKNDLKIVKKEGKISVEIADYRYGVPDRLESLQQTLMVIARLASISKAPKSEFNRGNLVTETSLVELSRKGKLSENDIKTLEQVALRSTGTLSYDSLTALSLLSRYISVADKESGERQNVVNRLAHIAMSAADQATKYHALRAMIESIPYFIDDPKSVTMPKDFADPSAGTEEYELARDYDPESAQMLIKEIKHIMAFGFARQNSQPIITSLTNALADLESSSKNDERDGIISALKSLISMPRWQDVDVSPQADMSYATPLKKAA